MFDWLHYFSKINARQQFPNDWKLALDFDYQVSVNGDNWDWDRTFMKCCMERWLRATARWPAMAKSSLSENI